MANVTAHMVIPVNPKAAELNIAAPVPTTAPNHVLLGAIPKRAPQTEQASGKLRGNRPGPNLTPQAGHWP